MEVDFKTMKRRELVALCKKHGLPTNITNSQMAKSLALISPQKEETQEQMKPKACLKGSGGSTGEDADRGPGVSKKVSFSLEEEKPELGDFEGNPDGNCSPKKRRTSRRRSIVAAEVGKVTETVEGKGFSESQKELKVPVRTTRRSQSSATAVVWSPGFQKKRGRKGAKAVCQIEEPPLVMKLRSENTNHEKAHKEPSGEAPATRSLRNRVVVVGGDEGLPADPRPKRTQTRRNAKKEKEEQAVAPLSTAASLNETLGKGENCGRKDTRKRPRGAVLCGGVSAHEGSEIVPPCEEPPLRRSKRNLSKLENCLPESEKSKNDQGVKVIRLRNERKGVMEVSAPVLMEDDVEEKDEEVSKTEGRSKRTRRKKGSTEESEISLPAGGKPEDECVAAGSKKSLKKGTRHASNEVSGATIAENIHGGKLSESGATLGGQPARQERSLRSRRGACGNHDPIDRNIKGRSVEIQEKFQGVEQNEEPGRMMQCRNLRSRRGAAQDCDSSNVTDVAFGAVDKKEALKMKQGWDVHSRRETAEDFDSRSVTGIAPGATGVQEEPQRVTQKEVPKRKTTRVLWSRRGATENCDPGTQVEIAHEVAKNHGESQNVTQTEEVSGRSRRNSSKHNAPRLEIPISVGRRSENDKLAGEMKLQKHQRDRNLKGKGAAVSVADCSTGTETEASQEHELNDKPLRRSRRNTIMSKPCAAVALLSVADDIAGRKGLKKRTRAGDLEEVSGLERNCGGCVNAGMQKDFVSPSEDYQNSSSKGGSNLHGDEDVGQEELDERSKSSDKSRAGLVAAAYDRKQLSQKCKEDSHRKTGSGGHQSLDANGEVHAVISGPHEVRSPAENLEEFLVSATTALSADRSIVTRSGNPEAGVSNGVDQKNVSENRQSPLIENMVNHHLSDDKILENGNSLLLVDDTKDALNNVDADILFQGRNSDQIEMASEGAEVLSPKGFFPFANHGFEELGCSNAEGGGMVDGAMGFISEDKISVVTKDITTLSPAKESDKQIRVQPVSPVVMDAEPNGLPVILDHDSICRDALHFQDVSVDNEARNMSDVHGSCFRPDELSAAGATEASPLLRHEDPSNQVDGDNGKTNKLSAAVARSNSRNDLSNQQEVSEDDVRACRSGRETTLYAELLPEKQINEARAEASSNPQICENALDKGNDIFTSPNLLHEVIECGNGESENVKRALLSGSLALHFCPDDQGQGREFGISDEETTEVGVNVMGSGFLVYASQSSSPNQPVEIQESCPSEVVGETSEVTESVSEVEENPDSSLRGSSCLQNIMVVSSSVDSLKSEKQTEVLELEFEDKAFSCSKSLEALTENLETSSEEPGLPKTDVEMEGIREAVSEGKLYLGDKTATPSLVEGDKSEKQAEVREATVQLVGEKFTASTIMVDNDGTSHDASHHEDDNKSRDAANVFGPPMSCYSSEELIHVAGSSTISLVDQEGPAELAGAQDPSIVASHINVPSPVRTTNDLDNDVEDSSDLQQDSIDVGASEVPLSTMFCACLEPGVCDVVKKVKGNLEDGGDLHSHGTLKENPKENFKSFPCLMFGKPAMTIDAPNVPEVSTCADRHSLLLANGCQGLKSYDQKDSGHVRGNCGMVFEDMDAPPSKREEYKAVGIPEEAFVEPQHSQARVSSPCNVSSVQNGLQSCIIQFQEYETANEKKSSSHESVGTLTFFNEMDDVVAAETANVCGASKSILDNQPVSAQVPTVDSEKGDWRGDDVEDEMVSMDFSHGVTTIEVGGDIAKFKDSPPSREEVASSGNLVPLEKLLDGDEASEDKNVDDDNRELNYDAHKEVEEHQGTAALLGNAKEKERQTCSVNADFLLEATVDVEKYTASPVSGTSCLAFVDSLQCLDPSQGETSSESRRLTDNFETDNRNLGEFPITGLPEHRTEDAIYANNYNNTEGGETLVKKSVIDKPTPAEVEDDIYDNDTIGCEVEETLLPTIHSCTEPATLCTEENSTRDVADIVALKKVGCMNNALEEGKEYHINSGDSLVVKKSGTVLLGEYDCKVHEDEKSAYMEVSETKSDCAHCPESEVGKSKDCMDIARNSNGKTPKNYGQTENWTPSQGKSYWLKATQIHSGSCQFDSDKVWIAPGKQLMLLEDLFCMDRESPFTANGSAQEVLGEHNFGEENSEGIKTGNLLNLKDAEEDEISRKKEDAEIMSFISDASIQEVIEPQPSVEEPVGASLSGSEECGPHQSASQTETNTQSTRACSRLAEGSDCQDSLELYNEKELCQETDTTDKKEFCPTLLAGTYSVEGDEGQGGNFASLVAETVVDDKEYDLDGTKFKSTVAMEFEFDQASVTTEPLGTVSGLAVTGKNRESGEMEATDQVFTWESGGKESTSDAVEFAGDLCTDTLREVAVADGFKSREALSIDSAKQVLPHKQLSSYSYIDADGGGGDDATAEDVLKSSVKTMNMESWDQQGCELDPNQTVDVAGGILFDPCPSNPGTDVNNEVPISRELDFRSGPDQMQEISRKLLDFRISSAKKFYKGVGVHSTPSRSVQKTKHHPHDLDGSKGKENMPVTKMDQICKHKVDKSSLTSSARQALRSVQKNNMME